MPEIEKKEPGRPAVQQRERGDPRQQYQPIDKRRDVTVPERTQDQPPPTGRGDSPWMGGG